MFIYVHTVDLLAGDGTQVHLETVNLGWLETALES